jgi:hypothetical protein
LLPLIFLKGGLNKLKARRIQMAIVIMLAIALGIFLAVAARQPDEFSVTRSAVMGAPAPAIFPHVNDLHKWDGWSPWAKLDPNAKNSFEGPGQGVGAKMSWEGNNKVGEGSMTITESHPDELVRFRLEFKKPMQATNIAEFVFLTEGDKTKVTWTMSGKNNFIGKVVGLVMNCEKMVGGQFENGLDSLKKIVEAQAS